MEQQHINVSNKKGQSMSINNVDDVFDWIGNDSSDVPHYLHLLHLEWSPEGMEKDIKHYCTLAIKLKNNPEIVRELIRHDNWRATLVGNAMAILLRTSEFEDDLLWRLQNWSWVSPQIAAGIGILSGGSAIPALEMILANASHDSDPKTILSAYSALQFLGSKKAKAFENNLLFDSLKSADDDNCIEVAKHHWNFWKIVIVGRHDEF
jgi:hypothetical protein